MILNIDRYLQDFLGVNIEIQGYEIINLTQPHLIDQIVTDLNIYEKKVKIRDTPSTPSKLLKRHSVSESHYGSLDCISVIGELNYLEKVSQLDISYIIHQCTIFTSAPNKEHVQALGWL